jgi:hypothetical protein
MVRPATKLKRVKKRLKSQGLSTQNAKIQANAEIMALKSGVLEKAGSIDCICPLCFNITTFNDGFIPKLSKSNFKPQPAWVCEKCDAWALCKQHSTQILGTIANRETWEKRRKATGAFFSLCCIREMVKYIQRVERNGKTPNMTHVIEFLDIRKSSLTTHRKTFLWLVHRLNKLESIDRNGERLAMLRISDGSLRPLLLTPVYAPMNWLNGEDCDKALQICDKVINRLSEFLNKRLAKYL